jgi:hypothetical protein
VYLYLHRTSRFWTVPIIIFGVLVKSLRLVTFVVRLACAGAQIRGRCEIM